MLMSKEMILTILIIALTLGAETELQIFPIFFRAAANGTFMSIYCPLSLLDAMGIALPPINSLRTVAAHIAHTKEKQEEIPQRD